MSRPLAHPSRRGRFVIAGAGALGSMIAWRLAEEGRDVVLVDRAPLGGNASGMAAGMLAPAFEAALDRAASNYFPLLKAARDLWPALAERLHDDIGFRRSGAAWIDLPGERPQFEALAAKLARLGALVEIWAEPALRTRIPELGSGTGAALFSPDDWRLDPPATLSAIRRASISLGVQVLVDQVDGFADGRVRLVGGGSLPADGLVLATGFARSVLAPELACLSPIKGQLVCFPGLGLADERPVLRAALGYAAPGIGGLRLGATMEAGAEDREIDVSRVEPFVHLARELFPAYADAAFEARAGVRAATPDALPLVGPSAAPGVYLAVGARRNGWLLAPLIADMTAAYLTGRDPGPFGHLLASNRCFDKRALTNDLG